MKREFLYFAIFFTISIILLQTILMINLITLPQNTQLTKAEATGGSFSLCLNFQPVINTSACPNQINQSTSINDNTLNCFVTASHPRNHTVELTQRIINQEGLNYRLYPTGELNIQGFQQAIGQHNFTITAQDNHPECPFTTNEFYELEILDINDPPYLVTSLPNVELNAGTESAPFVLNEYFDDVDIVPEWGKPLTYKYYSSGDIHSQIEISPSSSLVVIRSEEDNCEADYVYFEAKDRGNLTSNSNIVKINSICLDPDDQAPGMSGGSVSCEPKWQCEDWTECYINGTQKKSCEDKFGCEEPKIFWRDCEYTASCSDGIKNCHILPDGSILCEEDIDCGGPCESCQIEEEEQEEPEATCSDGIKNCHTLADGSILCEDGIDCGGPCKPCKRTETPSLIVDEEANNTVLYLALVIVFIASLITTYIIFRKQILTFFAKISWWLTRKKRKQFLLNDEDKTKFLADIKILYNKTKNSQTQNYTRKDKDIINTIDLSRNYLSKALKLSQEFDLETIKKNINKIIINSSFNQALNLYVQSFFEKERKNTQLTKQELLNFIQETRMLIMNTSKLKKDDFNFKATETDTQNNNKMNHALALIHNAYLALCFSEVISAQKNYYELLKLYDDLNDNEKNKLYSEISKIYHYIKTIISWI